MNGPVELRGGRARVNTTGSELPFSPCLLPQDPGPKYNFLSPELRARLAPQSPGLGLTAGTQPGPHWRPLWGEWTSGFQIHRSASKPSVSGPLMEPLRNLNCPSVNGRSGNQGHEQEGDPQVRAEQAPFPGQQGWNRGKSKGVCGGSEEGEAARMEGQGVISLRESRGAPSPWTLLPTDQSS